MIQVRWIGFVWFSLVFLGVSPAFSSAPVHKAVQYGEQALAFSSGFIREDLPSDGVVAQTAYNRQIVGHGDTVYLRMKHPEEVPLGGLYTVYRRSRKVFHPANGHYLGNLYSIVGVVQVTKLDHDLATAKVDRGYLWIAPGDMVMPFALPAVEEAMSAEPSLLDTTGIVLDIQTPRTLVAQSNIVYLDLGRVDGLRVGDRLDVLRSRRGFPTESIGDLKILAVEDVTATALIVTAVRPIAIGDQVIPKDPKELTRETAVQGAHAVQIRQAPVSSATKTRDSLTKSLQAEIATGDVSVAQTGNSVTISLNDLVNQLEYEPGEARIKASGIRILKQISEYLKHEMDNEILVEGHTDNQPIGPSLVKHYPTNQELSEARASLVVRYFIDSGIDPGSLTAIGYADTRPVSSNAREEGRKHNRRIEIVLTPRQVDVPQEESAAADAPSAAEPKSTDLQPDAEPLHVNIPHPSDAALQDPITPASPPPSSNN